MEKNSKFERTIFTLLRVFGVLTIVGGYLGNEDFFSKNGLLIFKHTTIIGNIFMISPSAIIGMIVTIIIYLVFIRFITRHISISKKII
jgi:hypothetical protein